MIENNKYVAIHYTGTFDGGEVFDTSVDGQPLEFQVGANMVIPGFENAVMDMNIGEKKEIRIEPADAYGEYDENRKQSFPLEEIRQSFEPQEGMTIGVQMENGMQIPAVITSVTASEVVIDMNHPLAGKPLNFSLELIAINDTAQYDHGCSCGCEETEGCGDGCGSGGCC